MNFSSAVKENRIVFGDMQGFKTNSNKFIVKEFCLLNDDFKIHDIIRSPLRFIQLSENCQKQASWLTKYFHGLRFDEGLITLEKLVSKASKHMNGRMVIVKGNEKVAWFNQIFGAYAEFSCVNIDNLDAIMFTEIDEFNNNCNYHCRLHSDSRVHCALTNTLNLRKYSVSII